MTKLILTAAWMVIARVSAMAAGGAVVAFIYAFGMACFEAGAGGAGVCAMVMAAAVVILGAACLTLVVLFDIAELRDMARRA